VKFSLQTVLALTVVAVLLAAIYGEQRRKRELSDNIAETEQWLGSFNHVSIECLPFYRKALEYEDPFLPFCDQLVAKVEETQKSLEALPDRHVSEVSALEIATMNPFLYTYAIHVPAGKSATATFYIAKKWNDPLEDHLVDGQAPFQESWSVEIPTGLSKLEVAQVTTSETPPAKKPGQIVFTIFTPSLQLRLNDEQIFDQQILGFGNLGSNHGWKPDAKSQMVLDESNRFLEFSTFRYTESADASMTGGEFPEPGKSFSVKFRLSAGNADESEVANEK